MIIKLQSKCDPSTPTLIAHFQDNTPTAAVLGKSKTELLAHHLKKKTFKGEAEETLSTHLTSSTRIQKVLFLGMGKEKEFTEKNARNMGAKAIRMIKGKKQKQVSIILPEGVQKYLQAFVEGVILGNFDPALHKTGEEQKKKEESIIKTLHLIAPAWTKSQGDLVKKAKLIAEVVNYTRNIVNCGPQQLSTNQFVKEVKTIAKRQQYKLTDINKRQLQKLQMGGILAVNRGSEEPAHLLILEHNPGGKQKPIVICGKGIIFDTGGVSLKPSAHLHEMQLDMAGAAVVLGIFKLLKKLNIKQHIIGIMPVTDNAIGSTAYRPSEIITTYSGKTVEVVNTDAEGRMILCDALHYGATKYKPQYLIDLATLTGACMAALGYRTAGLFGNNEKLIKLIQTSGENSDEAVCHLPITEADEKAMKGQRADLTNLDSTSRYAGASRAAAFLKNFVNKTKWAHIDIAGTAFTKEPKDYEVNMGTGYGVRLMIDFLEQLK